VTLGENRGGKDPGYFVGAKGADKIPGAHGESLAGDVEERLRGLRLKLHARGGKADVGGSGVRLTE